IGDRLLWLPSNVGYFANGKIYPLNGARDLLKLDVLPIHDRVRLGLVTAYLQRFRNWKEFEKVTAESWRRRALGKRAYERTWVAHVAAKLGRYAGQVGWVCFGDKSWLLTPSRRSPLDQEKLGYIRGSFNVLIDTLADAARNAGADLNVGRGPIALKQRDD